MVNTPLLKYVWAPYISTSFSNSRNATGIRWQFEHHTFLHHSQTNSPSSICNLWFEHHTFLHHSQTICTSKTETVQFEHHTFLHHSQTNTIRDDNEDSLSTIHFYIILKLKRSEIKCLSV